MVVSGVMGGVILAVQIPSFYLLYRVSPVKVLIIDGELVGGLALGYAITTAIEKVLEFAFQNSYWTRAVIRYAIVALAVWFLRNASQWNLNPLFCSAFAVFPVGWLFILNVIEFGERKRTYRKNI